MLMVYVANMFLLYIICLNLLTSSALKTSEKFSQKQIDEKPNILVIVTDDQDVTLHGMFPMERVQRLVAAKGVTFTNAFTSSPLCCPSRASILTGLYAHNHHTINNSISGGCYSDHWRAKLEPHTIATVLKEQGGYNTFFAGKYLNEYHGETVPRGWDDFRGLHGNSRYYNYTLRENNCNVSYGANASDYLTDVLKDLTLAFFEKRKTENTTRPFFAMIAPPAPHAPYTPAERHQGFFADVTAMRTPNFNRATTDTLEKHWLVASSNTISNDTLRTMDTYFRDRWEALLAVDELVETVLEHLERDGELERTFVIYTSDNGYHIGQFALPFDKRQPYETDIRVPLLIRGPGIPIGVNISVPTLLLDLFPTILDWAQISSPSNIDGVSLHPFLVNAEIYDALSDKNYRRALLIQHWGEGTENTYNPTCPWKPTDRLAECTPEAECHCQDSWNNTYACVRNFEYTTVDRLYCEFRDEENFIEAYDLTDDPYQMTNIGYELLPIESALYSLFLANLTRCSGSSCRRVIDI